MTKDLRDIVNEYAAKVPYVGEAIATERNLPDIDTRWYAVVAVILTQLGLCYALKYLNEKEALDQRVQCQPYEQQTNGGK